MQIMGIPQFPECAGQQQFPHISCPLNATEKKSLAGNASRLDLADIVVLSARKGAIRLNKVTFECELFLPGSKLPLFPYNRGWSSTQ